MLAVLVVGDDTACGGDDRDLWEGPTGSHPWVRTGERPAIDAPVSPSKRGSRRQVARHEVDYQNRYTLRCRNEAVASEARDALPQPVASRLNVGRCRTSWTGRAKPSASDLLTKCAITTARTTEAWQFTDGGCSRAAVPMSGAR